MFIVALITLIVLWFSITFSWIIEIGDSHWIVNCKNIIKVVPDCKTSSYCFKKYEMKSIGLVWFMVFNATFNNISWRSVLSVEETGVPGENHRSVARNWRILSHNVASSTPRHKRGSISGDRHWLHS
jgi:hypothetical protein